MCEEEDEVFGGLYEDGHWVWDDSVGELAFVSDLPPKPVEVIQMSNKAPTGAIEFRDDVDLIEQIRYRRRYLRKLKPSQPDIITLQDVKDLAIYTAPLTILSQMLIDMLHLSTTERFLRALILYNAYYLQVSEEISNQLLELEKKVRTPSFDVSADIFRDNLCDLRALVAKEYCIMLIGGADTQKFHHMGPSKKRISLSDKEAHLFETLLRVTVQIVWIALGRRNFNQIELETNRIFKSETFNQVEHNSKTDNVDMIPEKSSVLLGHSLKHQKKLNTHSPLMNEVKCQREIDFRLMGLGVVKPSETTRRIQYLWDAVCGDEADLTKNNVVLGIIGLPRSGFDTMLKPLPIVPEGKAKPNMNKMRTSKSSATSLGPSLVSARKSISIHRHLYPYIILPSKLADQQYFPPTFPEETEQLPTLINEIQRRRWQNRLKRALKQAGYK